MHIRVFWNGVSNSKKFVASQVSKSEDLLNYGKIYNKEGHNNDAIQRQLLTRKGICDILLSDKNKM